MWACGYGQTNIVNTQRYPPSGPGASTGSATDSCAIAVPCGVTLENLYVRFSTAPGGVTARTLTAFVGGVATAFTVTVSGANTIGILIATSVHLNAGQELEFRGAPTGAPAASRMYFTYETVTDNVADAIQWGINQWGAPGAGTTQFNPIAGGVGPNNGNSEARCVFPAAVAGTISAIYAYDNNNPGTDGTRGFDINLRQNTASVGGTIQLRGAVRLGSVTGLSLALAVADLICFSALNVVGANVNTRIGVSFCYQPTLGVPMLCGVDPTGAAASSVQYNSLHAGGQFFNSGGAGDPQSSCVVGVTSFVLSGMRVNASAGPGAASTVTYGTYQGGVGALTLAVTMATGVTSGADTTHTDILTPGMLVEIRHSFTGGGAGGGVGWSFVCAPAQTARLRTLMGIGQ